MISISKMTETKFKYGLNIEKKKSGGQAHIKNRRAIFDDDGDQEDHSENAETKVEDIKEIGGLQEKNDSMLDSNTRNLPGAKENVPSVKVNWKKTQICTNEDLSTSFTSKKYAEAAKELNANIYEYDAVYDSLKPSKKRMQADEDRKPKYMANLLAAAAVRKRDATIAEEKRLAREREAEGDEFADKEKFVTSAYKHQKEENRRLEEEEKKREEQEAKNNLNSGMLSFYKNYLEKGDQRHAEIVQSVDKRATSGPIDEEEPIRQKTAAEFAQELNSKNAGSVLINDEGDVVDKRQLLSGGLNIISKSTTSTSKSHSVSSKSGNSKSSGNLGITGMGGGKQAMRERQSRMIEAQLEQATKRALEQEDEEKQRIERISKSRKTETEIMSVKERYLARKKEAEAAKNKKA